MGCPAGFCEANAESGYLNTGICRMLNLGQGRSPLWCGSQNHHRDPRPGYGHLLRNLRAAQAAITSSGALFRRCYGPEDISGKLLIWAEKQGIAIQPIQPGQPRQNACIERYKPHGSARTAGSMYH
jgi:hypothetical protein